MDQYRDVKLLWCAIAGRFGPFSAITATPAVIAQSHIATVAEPFSSMRRLAAAALQPVLSKASVQPGGNKRSARLFSKGTLTCEFLMPSVEQ